MQEEPRVAQTRTSLLCLFVVVRAVYLVRARPSQVRRGATDEEVRRRMPGDELSPHPTSLATRATAFAAKRMKIHARIG